jgi:enamine deaminase RidA (YjgF/YER057c/UK114 family)
MAIRSRGVGKARPHAVVDGDKVYLAGQVADLAAGAPVAAQTREILARIDRLLIEAGSGKGKLLMANIRLSDMTLFAEMDRVWDDWVIEGQTPGRATVEGDLASPGHAIEIAVIAHR